MSTVGTDLYKLSPITGLIVVLAESIVLYLFGSRGLQQLLLNLHLPTIPLVPISSSQAVIGAVIGIGLTKGGRNIHFNTMGKIGLGWVSAPALACLLTFVIMFFVQNVFEQPVVNKVTYAFNKDELLEIQSRGVDIDHLTEVNGREYPSARALRVSLNRIPELNQEQKLILSNVSEIHNMKINYYKLKNELGNDAFTYLQWQDLRSIDGKVYIHKWQLEDDLCKLSSDWCFKPKTNKNQLFNSDLNKKYKTIEALCKTTIIVPADSLQ
jgi:PiT family inorganic phosphate transporter